MDVTPVSVHYYQTETGRCPFQEWFDALDRQIQIVIDARMARVRCGLLGEARSLGGGVWELKFDVGPGYRIYFGRAGMAIVILLHGGIKKGQSGDIATARARWADHLERTKHEEGGRLS